MSIPPSYNNPPNLSTAAGYAQQQQFATNFPLQPHQQQPNPGFGQQQMQQQFHPTMGMHPQQMVVQFGGMQQMSQQQPIQQMVSSSGGILQVHIQPSSQVAPSTSSAGGGGPPSHSGPAKPAQLPLEKRITPPGLPPQMLANSDEQMSVEMLCTLGRELVLELMTRMFSIVNTLKLNIKGDNKPNKPSLHGVDNVDTVRFQLEYSRLVFLALTEIRLRIDLKLSERLANGQTLKDANPTDAELLQILADPSPLLEEQNEEEAKKAALVEQFEQNRQQLVRLNCQMKKLEWLATCSDPATLNSASGGGRSGGGGRRSYESTTSRRS